MAYTLDIFKKAFTIYNKIKELNIPIPNINYNDRLNIEVSVGSRNQNITLDLNLCNGKLIMSVKKVFKMN